jgi:hypothetical protein
LPTVVSKSSNLNVLRCRNESDILKHIPFAAQAAFNSQDKQHDPVCLRDTRVDVLEQIMAWADGHDERRIFWLSGMAGTGKSTIARTVARIYDEQERLGASFFFSRGGGDVSHASKFFTTIAWQLANVSLELKHYICEAISKQNNIASLTFQDQWNQLLFQPLSKLKSSVNQSSLLLVIDALDECEGDNNIRAILQLLARVKDLETTQLRIFITSRLETPIRLGFRAMPGILHHDLVLDGVSRDIVDHDISVFLRYQFTEIRNVFEDLPADWPGNEKIALLVKKSEGLFIYAATACRFVKNNGQWSPQHLLDLFIHNDSESQLQKKKSKPRKLPTWELDKIYTQILEHAFRDVEDAQDMEELSKEFRQVIGALATLFEPLSAIALSKLLPIDEEIINLRLQCLRSVFNVPEYKDSPIRLLHPSFCDFLLDKQRCCNQHFCIDDKEVHSALLESSLQLMSSNLKRDICGLHGPGTLAREVENYWLEQCLPLELQYVCRYWVQHLQKSGRLYLSDDGPVHTFLQEHLLHWFEALGLMGKTSEGILAITLLESIIEVGVSFGKFT